MSSDAVSIECDDNIRKEIAELEGRLQDAKARLNRTNPAAEPSAQQHPQQSISCEQRLPIKPDHNPLIAV